MFRVCLVIILVSVIAPVAVSQKLVPKTELSEVLDKSARVSSGLNRVVSIIDADAFEEGASAFRGSFEVYASADTTICVEYLTRNGLYIGRQEFQSQSTGWAQVDYSSKYQSVIEGFGAEAFAVRATSGSGCFSSSRSDNLLAVRSLNIEQTDRYLLLTHSDGYPARVVTYKRGEPEPMGVIECGQLEMHSTTEFDKQCSLKNAQTGADFASVLVILTPGRISRQKIRMILPSPNMSGANP